MNGWLKIHRKMLEWEWYHDNNVKILFLHLMLKASFKESSWQGIAVLKGQLITSRDHLAEETGLSVQQVRTALCKLQSTNEITIKSTNRFTLITIEKYTFYQDSIEESNQQNNQPDNKQITTSKEVKETKKKDIVDYSNEIDELWKAYPEKKGVAEFKKKMPGLIKQHGFETMMHTILAYKAELESVRKGGFDRQCLNGGTFVNGRYKDYLESEKPEQQPLPFKKVNIIRGQDTT